MPHSTHRRPKLPFGEGEEGAHIRALQRAALLLECQYPFGASQHVVLSGRFKDNTTGWVKELQYEFRQPQTGKVDQEFIRALKDEAGIDFWKLLEFNQRRHDKKRGAPTPYTLEVVPPSA